MRLLLLALPPQLQSCKKKKKKNSITATGATYFRDATKSSHLDSQLVSRQNVHLKRIFP